MPIDPELSAYLTRAASGKPRGAMTVDETRDFVREIGLGFGGDAVDVTVDEGEVAGRPVRFYRGNGPVIAYFHGGRFFSGDLDSHDRLCRRLCAGSDCTVASIEYRLAPEHHYPAALDDCLSATRDLGATAIGGDSAGACLAAIVARHLADVIEKQLLLYPMIDATCGLPSHSEYATGYGPGTLDMQRGWREYLPVGADARNPDISPVFADRLAGLASAYVLTAEFDTLRDEGELYAKMLEQAGVPVWVRRVPGAIHGFLQLTGISALARTELHRAAEWLRFA